MLTCSWSGSTAPGAKRIKAVTRPVARSNNRVLASQPGKRVFCHSMSWGRTRWECLSAVCGPFGVTASMQVSFHQFSQYDTSFADAPAIEWPDETPRFPVDTPRAVAIRIGRRRTAGQPGHGSGHTARFRTMARCVSWQSAGEGNFGSDMGPGDGPPRAGHDRLQ